MKSRTRAELLARCSVSVLSLCWVAGCGSDSNADDVPIPVPDTFQAYFVAGDVCMPSQVATGAMGPNTAPQYPVRFDICRHRCITLDRATARIETSFLCAAGQCDMIMLARAQAYRVQNQENCDGRELPSPPPGSCEPETFTFMLDPPCCLEGNNYMTGNMRVSVPFMDLDQADEVSSRVAAGEPAQNVIAQVVGPPPADRQWIVNYDPGNAVVSDGATLSGADCHPIAAP